MHLRCFASRLPDCWLDGRSQSAERLEFALACGLSRQSLRTCAPVSISSLMTVMAVRDLAMPRGRLLAAPAAEGDLARGMSPKLGRARE